MQHCLRFSIGKLDSSSEKFLLFFKGNLSCFLRQFGLEGMIARFVAKRPPCDDACENLDVTSP